MKNALAAAALSLALLASLAAAADAPPARPWSDQAEASYVQTAGNTKTTTLAAKNLLKYRFTGKTTGSWTASALYGKDKGTANAEGYATELRLDHLLTERVYAYGLAGWNKNRFAGLEQRYYGGAGVGVKFLAGPAHFLLGELGVNGTREEYTDGAHSTFPTGRAFAKYEYALSEKSRFSQSVEYLHDFEDSQHYRIDSETALSAALTDVFSLKAAYAVKYDHEPVPATLKQTDTLLSMALVANF
jgi:putative salt-induced outer membrane protein